jgi:hypothetical protein
MKDFDSKKAKEIVDSLYNDELHTILEKIKSNAEKGESTLYIYEPLGNKTVDALKEKGFRVFSQTSIAVQRDELYYIIYW